MPLDDRAQCVIQGRGRRSKEEPGLATVRQFVAGQHRASMRVGSMLQKPTEYDKAVELLMDLRAVAERKNRLDVFERRFAQLRQQHLRKPSLLQRFDRARLTPAVAKREG
jgi:hypothetical protein